jgi:Zn-finger nucleic acid-binding protein
MAQDSATSVLVCPKCRAEMRTYERSGVTVDQCSECRGIFLDRGELERLIDAENAYSGTQSGQAQRGSSKHEEGAPTRKKKRSFLEGLFEGGED